MCPILTKGLRVWIISHNGTEERVYRASYLDVIRSTLRIYQCESKNPKMILTMPLKWVIEIRTLVEIVYVKSQSAPISNLPIELVRLINEFV
jgi:hypothetical protein